MRVYVDGVLQIEKTIVKFANNGSHTSLGGGVGLGTPNQESSGDIGGTVTDFNIWDNLLAVTG